MKILFLNHNITGRGTYWRCFHLAQSLAGLGHQVTLVSQSGSPTRVSIEKTSGDFQIILSPRFRRPGKHDGGWSPEDILWRSAWILRQKYDIIHAFAHRPNVSLPWMLRRLFSSKTAFFADWDDWWTRGGIITSRRRFRFLDTLEATLLEERIPRLARGVSAASSVLQKRALDLGIPPEKILLLPQGARADAIPVLDRRDCRKKLGLPEQAPIINFMGYAVWDVQILLEAFELVRRKFPSALLQVIGYDKDGVMPQLIAASSQRDAIIQQGQVDYERVADYLGAADVQVLPMEDRIDNRARWPVKLGDYLSSGRPVVVQDVGDAAQLAARHQTGEVTGHHPAELAEGICKILEDRQKADAMGRRARKVAEEEMQWSQRARDLLKFYIKLTL